MSTVASLGERYFEGVTRYAGLLGPALKLPVDLVAHVGESAVMKAPKSLVTAETVHRHCRYMNAAHLWWRGVFPHHAQFAPAVLLLQLVEGLRGLAAIAALEVGEGDQRHERRAVATAWVLGGYGHRGICVAPRRLDERRGLGAGAMGAAAIDPVLKADPGQKAQPEAEHGGATRHRHDVRYKRNKGSRRHACAPSDPS